MKLELQREIVKKLEKKKIKGLDWSKTPAIDEPMPGQRHPDKETLSVYLPRTLMRRLRKLAAERQSTVTAVVEEFIYTGTKSVTLTPEDYESIAQETRLAINRQKGRVRNASGPSPKGNEG